MSCVSVDSCMWCAATMTDTGRRICWRSPTLPLEMVFFMVHDRKLMRHGARYSGGSLGHINISVREIDLTALAESGKLRENHLWRGDNGSDDCGKWFREVENRVIKGTAGRKSPKAA